MVPKNIIGPLRGPENRHNQGGGGSLIRKGFYFSSKRGEPKYQGKGRLCCLKWRRKGDLERKSDCDYGEFTRATTRGRKD